MPAGSPLEAGVAALRSAAVVADLTGRGAFSLSGPGHVELLHGLVTNDVKALEPGGGCHAALLSPKGRMRAEMAILRTGEELLLDVEPALAAPLRSILEGYVPFSRARLDDLTPAAGIVHVEGPLAARVVAAAAGSDLPAAPYAHGLHVVAGVSVRVARIARAGGEGFDLWGARGDVPRVVEALATLGAVPVGADVLEAGRIEAGLPRWGAELDENVLPNEAGLERTSISYTKGCYLGQETVARLRTYGHVNRHLVALLLPTGCGAVPGGTVRSGEDAVGTVTSAVDSALRGRRVALAFVRRGHETPGTTLRVDTPAGAVEGVVAAVPL